MAPINEIISHYLEYKTKAELVEKKMMKLKKQLKDYLRTQPSQKYDSGECTVSIVSSKRSGISRKDIPEDLWKRYSVTTQFEMVCVRKKKSKCD